MATPAVAKDAKTKPLSARDSGQAATMKLPEGREHADICVRKPIVGSRTRFEKVCMNQIAWQAHVAAMRQMTDDWKDSGKGIIVE